MQWVKSYIRFLLSQLFYLIAAVPFPRTQGHNIHLFLAIHISALISVISTMPFQQGN